MLVAVGSKNPVKIEAVKAAFVTVWPEEKWEVEGTDVESGVSSQPMSDEESILGAKTRARRALEKLGGDFGVGLEGGLQKIGGHHFDCGWMAVVNKEGREGIGSSVKIMTPPKVMDLIHEGHELGAASDIIFGRSNSKQAEGYFGLMTNDVLTRSKGYRDGVIVALARFLHPHLF